MKFRNIETGIVYEPNDKFVEEQLSCSELFERVEEPKRAATQKTTKAKE